jgi:glycosyltransferase involved in cell wall biosynthesis
MKTLVLMLQSIRLTSNHGGSSKIVKDVCADLAQHEHDVTLLCSAADDNHQAFDLVSGVRVRPELPFRQSWQDTWLVPPADLARIITTTARHAVEAERMLIFDSHFLYPDIFPIDLPVVWSLRDFVYAQALQGSMAFRRDLLIAPSDYVRESYCDAVGAWLPGVRSRVITVRNGVDLERFSPRDSSTMRQRLGVQNAPLLLLAHRPEEAKGFGMALEICRRLATGEFPDIRLLIPRGTDTTIMPEVREFYDRLELRIADLGIGHNVIFLEWVSPEEMPAAYAAADITLCLGDIVEASSNVALESIACGTPVVASDVACFHEFPDAIQKVPVHDVDAAENAVLDILRSSKPFDVHAAHEELGRCYSYSGMLNGFRHAIETTSALSPLLPKLARGTTAKVPEWISSQNNSLYDEYRKTQLADPILLEIWSRNRHSPFDVPASAAGDDIRNLLQAGLLVAVG